LQTSVAFFRMENGGRNGPVHHPAVVTPPRRAAQASARPAKAASRPTPAQTHNGKDKSRSSGFNLNLGSGGADPRDADFERM
jgi:cell division septation protein DedD